jgi:FlaA1/EpsC-like NDP-sugar epimerase
MAKPGPRHCWDFRSASREGRGIVQKNGTPSGSRGGGRWSGGTFRKIFLVVVDSFLISAAYFSSFYLRLGWEGLSLHVATVLQTLPIVLAVSLYCHLRQGLFNSILRYASLDTALAVLKSVVFSVLLSCLVLFLLFRLDGIPRSVFVIHAMAVLLLLGGSRVIVRLRWRLPPGRESRKVLLYGAGDTAELVLRGLRLSKDLKVAAVGLIDDDHRLKGRLLHGVKIHGGAPDLPRVVRDLGVDELWICIQGLEGEKFRAVYDAARGLKVRVKILPRLEKTLMEEDLGRFNEPEIADLLRRPPRHLDRERMARWIQGRRILISGAGGSIGSELSRQVARFGPQSLALCDSCEFNLFSVDQELARGEGGGVQKAYLVDVRDPGAVRRMVKEAAPEIVFHAAAYKHVPLVELNPYEGVLTNVQGLLNVALMALDNEVKEFVFISTDKAVRPVSIMGATKRLGEIIIQVLNKRGPTRFSAVRFGNVLGSSGSVIPIFQEQIRRGEPLTVTHPDMTRYFMLISEAVELVIQSGSMGKGGDVLILDMGKPIRIAEMARDLIRLMGKEPDQEVPIRFIGPRPGEKIHEELLIGPEDSRTAFQDIWVDGEPPPAVEWEELKEDLDGLFEAAEEGNREVCLSLLEKLVPGFNPRFEGNRKAFPPPSEERERETPSVVALAGPVSAIEVGEGSKRRFLSRARKRLALQ